MALCFSATACGQGSSQNSSAEPIASAPVTTLLISPAPNVDATMAPVEPEYLGGVDGPVIFAPGPPTDGGEDASIEGVLTRDGNCLFVGAGEPGSRVAIIWPFGTRWDPATDEVVTREGVRTAVGSTFKAGGGYGSLDSLGHIFTTEALAERGEACSEGEFAVVQHSISAA